MMKKLASFLLFVVAVVATQAAAPKVVAHRGHWKPDGSAQNSIRALVKADSVGAWGSEFDVWLTADNVLVVNHNRDINGKDIETGKSKTLLKEKLSNGETLPTLDKFLDAAKDLDIQLVLEVKPHKDPKREDIAVPMIIEMVKQKGLTGRTTYITFSRHAYDLLVKQSGRPVYFLTSVDPGVLAEAGGTGPDFHISSFRKHPDWIPRFKKMGMPVNIWTVDSDADLTYCIDNEADFITTNNPERAMQLVDESVAPRDIKVLTFNLHAGSDTSIDTLALIINSANPDFVALQEVDAYTGRRNAPQHNGRNMVADLARATNMFPLYGRTLNFAGGYYGIGLLSKHPYEGSESVKLPNPKNVEPRVLLEGKFLIDGKKPFTVASTHLCVEDSATRVLQAQYIADRYRDAKHPVLLCGDFNTLPDSEPVMILEKVFENVSALAPTFPSGTPEKKLDYIFAKTPGRLETVSTEVVDFSPQASDHRPVVSTVRFKPVDIKVFEDEYRAMMDSLNIVGISMAVVKDNDIVYTNEFGYKDLDTKTPVDPETLFRIASISKSFTVTTLMNLYERGLVDITADVNNYLPFKLRNPRYPDVPITIEMMMSHTSSINDSQGYYTNFDPINPEVSGSDVIKCYNDYAPGTGYEYCNYNTNLLACVIENVTGRPWYEVVEETVLKPLGIKGGYNVDRLDRDQFATLYAWNGKEYEAQPEAYQRPGALDNYRLCVDSPRLSAAGGMKINAEDLAKYMLMHMNYGKSPLADKRIISEKSSRRMQTVISDNAPFGGPDRDHAGLGLMHSSEFTPGVELVGHTGGAYGLRSAMFFDPESKYGFVVICNGTTSRAILQKSLSLMYKHFINDLP